MQWVGHKAQVSQRGVRGCVLDGRMCVGVRGCVLDGRMCVGVRGCALDGRMCVGVRMCVGWEDVCWMVPMPCDACLTILCVLLLCMWSIDMQSCVFILLIW